MHPSEMYFTAQQIAQAGIIPIIAYAGGRIGWPLLSGMREGRTFAEEWRGPTAQALGIGLGGAIAAVTLVNGGGPDVNNVVLETIGAFGAGAVIGAYGNGLKAALTTKTGVLDAVVSNARRGAVTLGTIAATTYAASSYTMGRF
jgi:hypothetical protein